MSDCKNKQDMLCPLGPNLKKRPSHNQPSGPGSLFGLVGPRPCSPSQRPWWTEAGRGPQQRYPATWPGNPILLPQTVMVELSGS